MSRKLIVLSLILFSFLLTGCSQSNTEISEDQSKELDVKLYRCDLPLNECKDKWKDSLAGEWKLLISENPKGKNGLMSFSNDADVASILSIDKQLTSSPDNLVIDRKKWIIIVSEPNNQKCLNRKIYDITLDLTYHDYESKDKWYVEEYLKTHRIGQMRSYLEWLENPKIKLQPGDIVNLRFLWTIEFKWTSSPLMDRIPLHYVSKCDDTETSFEILHNAVEYNSKHNELRLFYWFNQVVEEMTTGDIGGVYNDIDSLMAKVTYEFDQRYGKNSEWTFLLNHLVNNSILSQYKKDYITMIFFDWLFQLSPSDKKTFVNKYGNFPSSTYEFSIDNIRNSYKPWFFFKNFFITHIFKELPILTTLCPIGPDGDPLDAYIIGMNVVNDLTVQGSMKEFYSEYLFKGCNLYYQ